MHLGVTVPDREPAAAKGVAASPKPRRSTRAADAGGPLKGYRTVQEDGCEAELRAAAGCFYVFDGETVAFYCRDLDLARKIRRRWAAEVRVFAQGDEEMTFHLPARLLPAVAGLAGVARRAA